MKPLTIWVILLIVFAGFLAFRYADNPAHRWQTILDGQEHPEALRYAQEFTASLQPYYDRNTGQILTPLAVHLSRAPDELKSPDGRFILKQKALKNFHHEITLTPAAGKSIHSVLVLQEGDPGSGTDHSYQWSSDSKAVFIYGSGKPSGYARTQNMALIYLVENRALYSIELGPILTERFNETKLHAAIGITIPEKM